MVMQEDVSSRLHVTDRPACLTRAFLSKRRDQRYRVTTRSFTYHVLIIEFGRSSIYGASKREKHWRRKRNEKTALKNKKPHSWLHDFPLLEAYRMCSAKRN
jgi:hypothetical protein